MKSLKYILIALSGLFLFSACSDDELPGNPMMDFTNNVDADAYFGDSIPFTIKASDVDVPLSTLKAQLYFGEEKVSETVIRTKVSGEDYTGKIFVPYFANIPDGTATLKFVLQNIHFTKTEKEMDLRIAHPDFEYLTFVAADGSGEYKMTRTAQYEYSFTDRLPQKMKGYVKTPKYGANGNELTFGYESNAIKIGAEGPIPFSNSKAGKYTITLNTFSFVGAPFVVLKLNGTELEAIDDNTSSVDMSLVQGQMLTPEGFPDYESWWIDPDYFEQQADGTLKFLPMSGNYRIIADSQYQYFRVYLLDGDEPAKLQDDGSGAAWIIGEGIGKPSISTNEVGWDTDKALCMAPIADKVYQVTVVAGQTIAAESINFKFFGAMGWDNGASTENTKSTSDLIKVGDGEEHDDGNLYLAEGKTLDANGIYVLTLDCTGGINQRVLSVKKVGEQAFVEKKIYLNDVKMNTTDNVLYKLNMALTQNSVISLRGFKGLDEWYADPNYFNLNVDDENMTFLPMDGTYKIVVNTGMKYISAVRLNGAEEATLGDDGHGAIWLMGWGVGSPSMDNQFGFNPGAAYCMAEIAPKIYKFIGVAGPESGSSIGQRFRTDYLSFKFFFQDGWGGELSGDNQLTLTEGAKKYLTADGNIELAAGASLEAGATYEMTVDLSKGNSKGVLDFVKK